MQIGSQYCFFNFDFCNLKNDLFNLDVLMFVWNLLVNTGFLFLVVQAVMIEVIDEDKIIKLIHDRYKAKILRSFIFIIFEIDADLSQFGSIKQDSILNYY